MPHVQNLLMSNSRIDKLEQKRAQLDAQLKAARARDRTQKRKDDTRRKIIAGALALEHAENNPNGEFSRTILGLIQTYVTADKERALFDLDPLPPQKREPANARKSWMQTVGLKK